MFDFINKLYTLRTFPRTFHVRITAKENLKNRNFGQNVDVSSIHSLSLGNMTMTYYT